MEHAFLNGFINHRNGSREQRLRLFAIARRDCGAQFLNLGAKVSAIAAIDFIAAFGLAHALFG